MKIKMNTLYNPKKTEALLWVISYNGCTASTIADHINKQVSSTTLRLNALELEGYVKKEEKGGYRNQKPYSIIKGKIISDMFHCIREHIKMLNAKLEVFDEKKDVNQIRLILDNEKLFLDNKLLQKVIIEYLNNRFSYYNLIDNMAEPELTLKLLLDEFIQKFFDSQIILNHESINSKIKRIIKNKIDTKEITDDDTINFLKFINAISYLGFLFYEQNPMYYIYRALETVEDKEVDGFKIIDFIVKHPYYY